MKEQSTSKSIEEKAILLQNKLRAFDEQEQARFYQRLKNNLLIFIQNNEGIEANRMEGLSHGRELFKASTVYHQLETLNKKGADGLFIELLEFTDLIKSTNEFDEQSIGLLKGFIKKYDL